MYKTEAAHFPDINSAVFNLSWGMIVRSLVRVTWDVSGICNTGMTQFAGARPAVNDLCRPGIHIWLFTKSTLHSLFFSLSYALFIYNFTSDLFSSTATSSDKMVDQPIMFQ